MWSSNIVIKIIKCWLLDLSIIDYVGYSVGGGGFSSGSESNNNRFTINANTINNNNSLRSVYLHEPAVIPEMPMPRTNSAGGGASLLSGRRTLSKDEISNYVRFFISIVICSSLNKYVYDDVAWRMQIVINCNVIHKMTTTRM